MVKKLDSQNSCLKKLIYSWRAIQVQGRGLSIFSVQILDLVILLRFLDLIIHQEVPKLFSQQELRGLVDKTTDQQS